MTIQDLLNLVLDVYERSPHGEVLVSTDGAPFGLRGVEYGLLDGDGDLVLTLAPRAPETPHSDGWVTTFTSTAAGKKVDR